MGLFLGAAIAAHQNSDTAGELAAITALLEQAQTSGWQPVVEQVLTARLRASISWARQHGWQPADLVRLVSHRLTSRHVLVLTDAIAAELQAYAAATIDPRWSAQLA